MRSSRFRIGREEQDRHAAHLAQAAAHRDAVRPRHVHIQHDGVQPRGGGQAQRFLPVECTQNFIAFPLQISPVGGLQMRIVVHQQHTVHFLSPFPPGA